MNALSKLHPVTKAVYFCTAFLLVLTASNPVMSIVSLCGVLLYQAVCSRRAFFADIKLALVVTLAVGLMNTLFSHYGMTVLFGVKDINFTLEALLYGVNQGAVLSSIIILFKILSNNSNASGVMYLLSFAPKFALLFSMVLGFIPRFERKLSDIREAQKALYGFEERTKKEKFRAAVSNLSALVTYSLESSIVTADSMKARGYIQGKKAIKKYALTPREACIICANIALVATVLYFKYSKKMLFIFEPEIYYESFSIVPVLAFAALMLMPAFIEIWEVLLWKKSTLNA